ncbi:MAG: metal ABC transporter ATP-binding protein [Clostridia bacterium]|nr:metal ABC transporter ATP-binding protein [Clostridia bacterium]
MAQLTCNDLTLGYESGAILEGLSFSVEAGDYLAIVGENGSGKSTLMKTILGLLKPLKGEIVRGEGLRKYEIGYLPQQSMVQRDFPASVWEVVLSGCLAKERFFPFYTRADKERAMTNVERLGITPFLKRSYRELSGGQQQRVLLARALCATEKILLLDEPVSGLDPVVTAEMYEIIKALNDEGITIIMISHDVQAAVRYASKILHIGKSPYFGTVAEYLASERGKRYLSEAAAGEGGEV